MKRYYVKLVHDTPHDAASIKEMLKKHYKNLKTSYKTHYFTTSDFMTLGSIPLIENNFQIEKDW